MVKHYGVRAELTATPRVAVYRFTFPAKQSGHLIFDVGNQQGESGPVLDAGVRLVNEQEIEGFVVTHPKYINTYQPGAAMKMYFVARLDRKTSELGTFRGSDSHPGQSAILGARAEQVNRSTITTTRIPSGEPSGI